KLDREELAERLSTIEQLRTFRGSPRDRYDEITASIEKLAGETKSEFDEAAKARAAVAIYEALLPEADRYYLKAMNCPHHHKLFAAVPRSYRDLPLRLAEYGTCYRYERSGELFGLMRVRSLQMNDAHLYMTPEQFEAEFNAVNEMYLNYFKLFGIDKYLMRFS